MARTRLFTVLVAVVLVGSLLTIPASVAAQNATENATATPTPTAEPTPEPTPEPASSNTSDAAGDEWTIETLRRGGTQVDERFESLRVIDENSHLWIVRYPPGPFKAYGDRSDQEFLSRSDVVKRDRLRLVASHPFDGQTREYDLTIVYWEPVERKEQTGNGTTVTRTEANVIAVDNIETSFEAGIQKTSDIDLRSFYDREVRVTMVLDSGTNTHRWTFRHESVPTTKPLDINSEGDFWSEVFLRFGWIVLLGVPMSGYGARSILAQTEVGPMKGAVWWIGVFTGGLFLIAAAAWYEATEIITRLPQIGGLLICLIAFVVYLEGFDGDIKKALFEQSVLTDARAPEGEEIRDERYRKQDSHRVVETDDGHLAIVSPGIRPFLARFFASPAKIPIEDVKTQVRGEGPFDEIYVSDPGSEEVLIYSAPTLAFEPELVADVDDELDDDVAPGMLERINWDLLVIGAVGVGLGWHAGAHFVDVPAAGAAVGLLPALGMAVNAYDGTASFDPAPIHTTQAQATLAWEQAHYADASLNEDLREVAWKERLKTALEGMALQKEADETITSELNRAVIQGDSSIDDVLDDLADELDGDEENGAIDDSTGFDFEEVTAGGNN